jgi:hypothetical protein
MIPPFLVARFGPLLAKVIFWAPSPRSSSPC